MQDQFDDWITGGLTIAGAMAGIVVWLRKMRVRLISGKDLAEMNARHEQEAERTHADMLAIKAVLEKLQTDVDEGFSDTAANQQAFAQGMTEMRTNQEWIMRQQKIHEERLNNHDDTTKNLEGQVTQIRRMSRKEE